MNDVIIIIPTYNEFENIENSSSRDNLIAAEPYAGSHKSQSRRDIADQCEPLDLFLPHATRVGR